MRRGPVSGHGEGESADAGVGVCGGSERVPLNASRNQQIQLGVRRSPFGCRLLAHGHAPRPVQGERGLPGGEQGVPIGRIGLGGLVERGVDDCGIDQRDRRLARRAQRSVDCIQCALPVTFGLAEQREVRPRGSVARIELDCPLRIPARQIRGAVPVRSHGERLRPGRLKGVEHHGERQPILPRRPVLDGRCIDARAV
jgi:hypothetical protein